MGSWYAIGLLLGLGVAFGVIAAGAVGRRPPGIAVGGFAAAAVGVGVGVLADGSLPPVAGGIGGVLGMFGACQLVRGAVRRGGTESGTAAIVGVAGLVLGALALVPVVGYVEAVVVPLIGVRLRRRAAKRYAGLRTLAK